MFCRKLFENEFTADEDDGNNYSTFVNYNLEYNWINNLLDLEVEPYFWNLLITSVDRLTQLEMKTPE